ncbi:hypothetical protein CDD81_5346 [Ophiocordyceps australis]|uniref:Trichodiene oxygenase n=1 Tax=Ophiocordyceps australis TaxID=1399860 RepID=A0A2C5XIJ4_9HYPO|nr:hypothetical protein CDD81_5346 [Ophiocordyceps australis]
MLNIGCATSAFTRDVGIEFILGKIYGSMKKTDFDLNLAKVYQRAGLIWRITKHIRWFGPVMRFLPNPIIDWLCDESLKSMITFCENTKARIRETVASDTGLIPDETPSQTITHAILHSNLPPEEKTMKRIQHEIRAMVAAASETTAQTMRLVIYYVYSDIKILSKLRAEIRAATAPHIQDGTLDLANLEKLPFLTAILMEGLRLSPGVVTRLARISPDSDLFYKQWRIPAGTPTGMTALLMHLDEELFPEPTRFNPSRWSSDEVQKSTHKNWAPFSRGTRMCLGMHLAWAELYMLIASLVMRFNFDLADTDLRDVVPVSDNFAVGVRDFCGVKAYVTKYEET